MLFLNWIKFNKNHLFFSYKSPSNSETIANAPVFRHEDKYNMGHAKRGKAIIFNHEHFNRRSPRKGTQIDCNALKNTFEKLLFDVKIYDNLCYVEILEVIKQREYHWHRWFTVFGNIKII